MPAILDRARRLALRLWRDRRGVAAVEFAFVMPVLLLLYVGTVELSIAIAASKKLQSTSLAVSDLIARETELTPELIDRIFAVSRTTMHPYAPDDVVIRVYGVKNTESRDLEIAWTRSSDRSALNEPPRATELLDHLEGNFFILTQTSMAFTPLSGLTDLSFALNGQSLARVRLSNDLQCEGC